MSENHRRPALDLQRLSDCSIAELRELWKIHMGRATAPEHRRLLIRELAWRTQEREYGGLDAQTRKLLNEAVREAATDKPSRLTRLAPISSQDAHTKRRRRPHGSASVPRIVPSSLPTNARLTHEWSGQTHEVLVLEGGRRFKYRDKIYASLSEIAREITGVRWSGPKFFGLTNRIKPAS